MFQVNMDSLHFQAAGPALPQGREKHEFGIANLQVEWLPHPTKRGKQVLVVSPRQSYILWLLYHDFQVKQIPAFLGIRLFTIRQEEETPRQIRERLRRLGPPA